MIKKIWERLCDAFNDIGQVYVDSINQALRRESEYFKAMKDDSENKE